MFYLDLNIGAEEIVGTPAIVRQTVLLARKQSSYAHYGKHKAILDLVAEIPFDNDKVFWGRSYRISGSDDPKKWITLQQWLENEGVDIEAALAKIK